MTRKYLLRVSIVIVVAVLFFKFVCVPFRVKGYSMMPTYQNGKLNFCFRPGQLFSNADKKDVVVVRMAGTLKCKLKKIRDTWLLEEIEMVEVLKK